MVGRISGRYVLSFEWKRVEVMDSMTVVMMGEMSFDDWDEKRQKMQKTTKPRCSKRLVERADLSSEPVGMAMP